MKCIIKRPKIILNKKMDQTKYYILNFSAKLFSNNKKDFNLLKLCVGNIEEVNKDTFVRNNLIPFYRRNNLNIAFLEVCSKSKFQKYNLLLLKKNNIYKPYECYLQELISTTDFSIKTKHVFTSFFRNHYNQCNH